MTIPAPGPDKQWTLDGLICRPGTRPKLQLARPVVTAVAAVRRWTGTRFRVTLRIGTIETTTDKDGQFSRAMSAPGRCCRRRAYCQSWPDHIQSLMVRRKSEWADQRLPYIIWTRRPLHVTLPSPTVAERSDNRSDPGARATSAGTVIRGSDDRPRSISLPFRSTAPIPEFNVPVYFTINPAGVAQGRTPDAAKGGELICQLRATKCRVRLPCWNRTPGEKRGTSTAWAVAPTVTGRA
jgi:hypothetical protein